MTAATRNRGRSGAARRGSATEALGARGQRLSKRVEATLIESGHNQGPRITGWTPPYHTVGDESSYKLEVDAQPAAAVGPNSLVATTRQGDPAEGPGIPGLGEESQGSATLINGGEALYLELQEGPHRSPR